MKPFHFLIIGCLIALGITVSSQAADIGDRLDEMSEQLAQTFLPNVQPLFVTFTVRSFDEAQQMFVFQDIIRISTAVAVFGDERGTFWLTVPAAHEFNDTSFTLVSTRFQLADGLGVVELFKTVDNRNGYYTVFLEQTQRTIAPVTLTTRATQLDRTGAIMTLEGDNFVGVQTTPRFNSGTETFDFRRGWKGFSFELNCPAQGTVRGAPVFFYRPDPFVRPDEPFLLGGLLLDINTARTLASGLPVISDLGFATLLPSLEEILTPDSDPR